MPSPLTWKECRYGAKKRTYVLKKLTAFLERFLNISDIPAPDGKPAA